LLKFIGFLYASETENFELFKEYEADLKTKLIDWNAKVFPLFGSNFACL
jgi:hypothetical protein